MKPLALAIGVFVAAIGIVAVVNPDTLLAVVRELISPGGLYFVAAFRIAVGVIFLRAAAASRIALTLAVLGGIILISGLVTPFIGVERSRVIFEWWAGQPGFVMRAWGIVVVVLGAMVVYGVGGARRRA